MKRDILNIFDMFFLSFHKIKYNFAYLMYFGRNYILDKLTEDGHRIFS